MPSEMPWRRDSASVGGRKDERKAARDLGARLHPNSGAGTEKNDYSTEDAVFEHKSVKKSHTMKAEDVAKLFLNAAKQGKEARYVVYFADGDITVEGVIRKGR